MYIKNYNIVLDDILSIGRNIISEDLDKEVFLYHYTKLDFFESIIKSGELYFTEYKHLNYKDPNNFEIKQSVEILKEILESEIKKNYGIRPVLEALLKIIDEFFEKQNIYVCSFCLAKDYNLAWERYADKSNGFALGFNQELFDNIDIETNTSPIIMTKVNHNELEFKNKCNDLIELVAIKYNDIHRNIPKEKIYQDMLERILFLLIPLIPSNKKLDYSLEKEFRFWIIEPITSQGKPFCKFPYKRQNDYTISLPFDKKSLREIWCGSKILPNNIYTLQNICHAKKYLDVQWNK